MNPTVSYRGPAVIESSAENLDHKETTFAKSVDGQNKVMKSASEPAVQRKLTKEKDETIQRKESGMTEGTVSPSFESTLAGSKGGGEKMGGAVQGFMSSKFGTDFGSVNVHNDSRSHQLANQINAKAFTVGEDIYFNQGEYQPNSVEGKHLLAHELAHTKQQKEKGERISRKSKNKSKGSPAKSPSKEKYELANKPYEEKKLEMVFSVKEKKWIEEVFSCKELQLLLSVFPDLPTAILHRVSKIKSSSGAKGQFSKPKNLAISSDVYKNPEALIDKQGKYVKETTEELFKGTLIHEITHFVIENTRGEVKRTTLYDMSKILLNPKLFRQPKYYYGWFYLKNKNIGGFVHFDVPELIQLGGNLSIVNNPKLMAIKRDKKYEASPMHTSGNSISVEEDISETVSLYLTSDNSRRLLAKKFPRRFNLMERYFKNALVRDRAKQLSKKP